MEKETVDSYKGRRLEELKLNKTPFIEELVKGSTKEEVEQSIQLAVATAEKYQLPAGNQNSANTPSTVVPPVVPTIPATTPTVTTIPVTAAPTSIVTPTSTTPSLGVDIGALSDKEFAAQRENILKQLKSKSQ